MAERCIAAKCMSSFDDPDDRQFWTLALTFIWVPSLVVGYFYACECLRISSQVFGMLWIVLLFLAPLICFRAAFLLKRVQTRNTRLWIVLNSLVGILCLFPPFLVLVVSNGIEH